MLTVPAHSAFEGVTVFADDQDFWRFYPIAGTPRVRLDAEGRPVFLLVAYEFSDQDRENRPSLPTGGGYLNFDVSLAAATETLDALRAHLQPSVDAEWARLRAGTPEERARRGAELSEPPRVEFGTPTWTGGAVSLDAPRAAELVSARVAEGKPSLTGDNNAAFSLDLTGAGATFMRKVMVGDGTETEGGSHLTALQVKYQLTFWARLPPVTISVNVHSEQVHEQVRKVMDGHGVDHCTRYDFAHTDLTETTATASGLVEVQIDTGGGSLSDEVLQQLRQYSVELLKSLVESRFFSDAPESGTPDEAELPEVIEAERNNPRKYFRRTFDRTAMDLSFTLKQRSVVEWHVAPNATLETFFAGKTPAERAPYVRVVRLDDPMFQTLGLSVSCPDVFEGGAIELVRVDLSYSGTHENGERETKTETIEFPERGRKVWNPALIGESRDVRWRFAVQYRGRPLGEPSEWKSAEGFAVTVPVAGAGRVRAAVVAGALDFRDAIERVDVTLRYEDSAHGVAAEDYRVVLTSTAQEAVYERVIYAPVAAPLLSRCVFTLKSGAQLEEPDFTAHTSGSGHFQVVVDPPTEGLPMSVRLMPTPRGWELVAQAIVDLRYADEANDYRATATRILRTADQFESWSVPLKNDELRTVERRITLLYKNGDMVVEDWERVAGDVPIAIRPRTPAEPLRIVLVPTLIDFAVVPVVEVRLTYEGGGLSRSEAIPLRNKEPVTYTLDVPVGAPRTFKWQATYYPSSGPPVTLPAVSEIDGVVTVPAWRAPESATLVVAVHAALVDFAATPIVAVDLKYDDDENDLHAVGALELTDKTPKTWTLELRDAARRHFSYRLTYFTAADGQPHAGEWQSAEVPRIIVPRFAV